MKKRIALASAAVMLVALIVTGGTLAWFTDEEQATNIVTTGNVKIALHDDDEPIADGVPKIDFAQVNGVVPGREAPKFVTVKNTGSNPAFIRVKIAPVWYGADGQTELTPQQIEAANLAITLSLDTEDWTALTDGYYIYKQPLAPGAVAPTLLSKVTFSTGINNNAFNYTLKIFVQAEAIQSENTGATYATVWDLLGSSGT